MSGYLIQEVAESLHPAPPDKMGVAVSGGGDSVALLCLMQELAAARGIELHAVSVDHGLREAAAEEVRAVTELCGRLGIPHHVEYWRTWSGRGNLMAEARAARYALLADWAHANDVPVIAMGHTADDQAETLIMRLMRGAGVDGLSAMAPRRLFNGLVWLRPLLRVNRRDLRYYLQSRGETWIEDPTNEDRDFERIRVRDALRLLEPLGLRTEVLVEVAQNMRSARDALDWQTFVSAQDVVKISHGAVAMDSARFRVLPEEIGRRMVLRALSWVSGVEYAPRRSAVQNALQSIRLGQKFTLAGCQILTDDGIVWIHREFQAVRDTVAELGESWDDRWIVTGDEDDQDISVRALGEHGLTLLENPVVAGVPRSVLAVTPAVWLGNELLAAPLVVRSEGWQAELDGGKEAFFADLLAH